MSQKRQRIGHKSKSFPEEVMKQTGRLHELRLRIKAASTFFIECPAFLKKEDEDEFHSMNQYFNYIIIKFYEETEKTFFKKITSEDHLETELVFIEEYIEINLTSI